MSEKHFEAFNDIDQHVGSRLRQRRAFLDISQKELGEAIGVSFQQVQKYERGKNRIGASRLFVIAKILGVEVSYFYEGCDEMLNAVRNNNTIPVLTDETQMQDRDAMRLHKAFSKIENQKLRKEIIKFISSIPLEDVPVEEEQERLLASK